jgi:hypothetical protein
MPYHPTPCRWPPLKRPYNRSRGGRPKGGRPAAFFYPLEYPMPYASGGRRRRRSAALPFSLSHFLRPFWPDPRGKPQPLGATPNHPPSGRRYVLLRGVMSTQLGQHSHVDFEPRGEAVMIPTVCGPGGGETRKNEGVNLDAWVYCKGWSWTP